MVLKTSFFLIAAGALVFWFSEAGSAVAGRGLFERLQISVFQSVTCRTAGFNTVDIGALRNSTLAFMLVLMFIGASPGSCGGGIKTTTLAVIWSYAWSRLKSRVRVNLFKKSMPVDTVNKSLTLVLLSGALIFAVFFLLLLVTPEASGVNGLDHHGFLAGLFETVSAFGTVGLSMGLTPELTAGGKALLILLMLAGRVGILTFSYVLFGNRRENGFEYAEENLMIG